MNFAEKLSSLRKQHNLSQEELAERLQVSRQAISRWEQGATLPDAPNLLALSNIFAVSTDYLLRDELTEAQPTPTPQPQEQPPEAAAGQPTPPRSRRYLYIGLIWTLAAACWLFSSLIDNNAAHAALCILNGIVAIFYIIKYDNSR